MKKHNITTSIAVITILHTCNAIADTRSQCQGEVATQYTQIVNSYKSTGKCDFSGGRLQALHNKVCECVTSGKTSAFACAAAQEICCGSGIEYDVSNTTNHVQTAKKHTWNASTQTCSVSTIYRCETGYYGNPTSASSGCTICYPWLGKYSDSVLTNMVYGTTDVPGATSQSDCFIPIGTYYDSTGTLEIAGNCMYQ